MVGVWHEDVRWGVGSNIANYSFLRSLKRKIGWMDGCTVHSMTLEFPFFSARGEERTPLTWASV